MLHIIPVQSKDEQKALAESFGEPFEERALAYLAAEQDENEEKKPLGFMQFTLGERAEVLCIREAKGSDDLEAMMITARAAFSFIHRVGINEVFAKKGTLSEKLALALGLVDAGDAWKLDLFAYFTMPCSERSKLNAEGAK